MKNLLFLAGLLFTASAGLYAQTPEQIFARANEMYQQNKIADAMEAYESILKNGYVSGELLYNLGNAYYRSGNIPKAILSYERARRWMPSDDDLAHNLQIANLKIVDRIEPTPRLFIWDYWDGIKNLFSLQAATWWAYGGFLTMLGLGATVVLVRTYALRKAALYAAAASVLVFAALLTIFLAKVSEQGRTDEAIVLAAVTNIKNSPDASSSDAFVLHGGVKVKITDRVNDWVKIRLADGKVGWIQSSAVESI